MIKFFKIIYIFSSAPFGTKWTDGGCSM